MSSFLGPDGSLKTVSAADPMPTTSATPDGGNITIGAKADAAATDSTSSWSVVALLKGIWQGIANMSAKLPASLGRQAITASLSTIFARGTNSLADSQAGSVYWAQLSCAAVASQYSQLQVVNPASSGKTVILYTCAMWGSSGTNVYAMTQLDAPLATEITTGIKCVRLNGASPTTKFYKGNTLTAVTQPDYANTSVAATTPQGTNILLANTFITIPEGCGVVITCGTVNVGINAQIAFGEI